MPIDYQPKPQPADHFPWVAAIVLAVIVLPAALLALFFRLIDLY